MTSAGDERSVTAVVTDGKQLEIPSPSLTWSSSAPNVATVSGTGGSASITAVDDGSATITAASGSVRGTVVVTVRRKLASVVLTAPSAIVVHGSTMQLTATGRDARDHAISGLTGFTYSSNNPRSVIVSSGGLVMGLFALTPDPSAIITARLTRDGVTASGSTEVRASPPAGFDYAALMLSEYEQPSRVPTLGQGIGYFTLDGTRINYTVTWATLSGPAIAAHIHGPAGTEEVVDELVDLRPSGQTNNYGAVSGSFTAADIHPQNGRPAIALDSLVQLLRTGKAYLDVHTAAFSLGEVRGQVFGPFR